jgi:protein SCO1/2
MRFLILFLPFILLFTACKPAANSSQASANALHYKLKGKVLYANKITKKIKVDHEAVEGYMDAMTMEFPVHADRVWDDLDAGVEITADLIVDNEGKDPFWLENLVISAPAKAGQADVPVNGNFAQVGQEVPDFSLTNQDGKKISINDFRGKVLAITFIYAKCPLPDYCIRMSTNFSDLANHFKDDANMKGKVSLLSISFDPANDTPEKLKAYGTGYLGKDAKPDFTIWQLAVGPDAEVRKIADFFGLRYEVDANDKTQINHSLRTAVIGPDGKVIKIYTGNDWTIAQLLKDFEAAAPPSTPTPIVTPAPAPKR